MGLHWHCHSSRMDGQEYGDEPARQDLSTEYAPKLLRDWLRKPARTIRHVAATPEDGVRWLRSWWEPVRDQSGEAHVVPDEVRFGRALYDLRCGNDLCWGFWLGGAVHLHLALVGTVEQCHR